MRAKDLVCVLQDLDARRDGIVVPFLGMPASAHEGIVKLHKKFGAPVLPALYVRAADRIHHRLVIQGILSDEVDEDGNPFGTNLEKSLRMCHMVLEGWVRAYPGQWLWLLDRWESTMPWN